MRLMGSLEIKIKNDKVPLSTQMLNRPYVQKVILNSLPWLSKDPLCQQQCYNLHVLPPCTKANVMREYTLRKKKYIIPACFIWLNNSYTGSGSSCFINKPSFTSSSSDIRSVLPQFASWK